jgi:hypothetical protein
MKKLYILTFLFFYISFLNAQTGIGTTTPNASAKLDVYSTNKGFLPPRVTLTSATDATTIASPAEGLLVYNLGSVGLQAGYYYWNGANWATIATATSAGNWVASSDLVKLYAKAYSTASGDIANSNGYSFTVPVSGRYLFDFNSTAYSANSFFTINFKVRQGSTDLGSDSHTSVNNDIRVEYDGKVEVNLQAGTTYNVYVTGGSRNANDYDRVYYKMVAGNLPVTGQSVDYVAVQASSDLGSITAGTAVKFNTTLGGNIPYDATTGQFSLSAGKTYRLTGMVTLGTQAAGTGQYAEANIVWRTGTAASGTNIGNYGQILSGNSTYNGNGQGVVDIIYTPTSNTTVLLYVNAIASTVSFRGGYTNAIIEQIGSSAIVNPWVLSGNDVYNITGEVGIGTSSPSASALLDLSSTNKGILIPRMTASQKSAISSPTTGLLIFQTDAPAGFYYFNGSSWISISNPGTTTRFLLHSSNFTHLSAGQSLTSLASGSGSYLAIASSDLVIDVPSGYSSNKVVIKWDTWGDVSASSAAHGSFRYQIKQTGTSTATYGSAAMNGWAVTGSSAAATRFATPVTYILTDLAPGTYTFKLEISREAEVGTITNMNNYHVSGSVQVFVK